MQVLECWSTGVLGSQGPSPSLHHSITPVQAARGLDGDGMLDDRSVIRLIAQLIDLIVVKAEIVGDFVQ
jgi:hypothetical protein